MVADVADDAAAVPNENVEFAAIPEEPNTGGFAGIGFAADALPNMVDELLPKAVVFDVGTDVAEGIVFPPKQLKDGALLLDGAPLPNAGAVLVAVEPKTGVTELVVLVPKMNEGAPVVAEPTLAVADVATVDVAVDVIEAAGTGALDENDGVGAITAV